MTAISLASPPILFFICSILYAIASRSISAYTLLYCFIFSCPPLHFLYTFVFRRSDPGQVHCRILLSLLPHPRRRRGSRLPALHRRISPFPGRAARLSHRPAHRRNPPSPLRCFRQD